MAITCRPCTGFALACCCEVLGPDACCFLGGTERTVTRLNATQRSSASTSIAATHSLIVQRLYHAGVIARNGFSNGERVFSGFNQRLRFTFTDFNRTLLKKPGQTVQLTGTLRRGGKLLSYCFVSYLKVC